MADARTPKNGEQDLSPDEMLNQLLAETEHLANPSDANADVDVDDPDDANDVEDGNFDDETLFDPYEPEDDEDDLDIALADDEDDEENGDETDRSLADDPSGSDVTAPSPIAKSRGTVRKQPPANPFLQAAKNRQKHRKKRKKGRGLSCSLVLLTLIFAVSILAATVILAGAKELYGIDKDLTEKVVVIPKGASTAEIATLLEKEGIIRIPKLFRVMSRLNAGDGNYIAGEHVVSPSMSYETIIEELTDDAINKKESVTVTFREGINMMDAAKLLEENEVCDASDFIFYFNAGGYGFAFEEHVPQTTELKFYRMEGYLFPDTYDFYVGEDPQIVVQKIYANFDKKLNTADYKQMDRMGMSLDDVITLASVVQAEAPSASSMKMVASVFENRLKNSATFPMLQSDPTRIYAENVIAPNLSIQNKLMCDAYNTYVGQGLPPGAINNPSKDAIDAVLNPAESDYYYFRANVQTGEIFYAKTLQEHDANGALIEQQQKAAGLADGTTPANG